jgi:hypothetical protein
MVRLTIGVAALALVAGGCKDDMGNSRPLFGQASGNGMASTQSKQTAQKKTGDIEALVRDWPKESREAAMTVAQKYGPPKETGEDMLVWGAAGPWKRTIVFKEPVQHDFPMPHKDVLEQFIDYRVPPEKFSELAAYDGSVIAERTKGELSARCDKEELNMLALNLANDIVQGRRSVEDARAYYARAAMDFKQGKMDPYTQSLQFRTSGKAGDPDHKAEMKPMDMSR